MFNLIPLNRVAARSFLPIGRVHHEFDALLDHLFRGAPAGGLKSRSWGLDATENEQEFLVKAELPGFDVSELDVQLADNALTLTAEKKKVEGQEGEGYKVERVVNLPDGIDVEKVEAKYINGVLEVRVAKHEQAKPKKIAIQA